MRARDKQKSNRIASSANDARNRDAIATVQGRVVVEATRLVVELDRPGSSRPPLRARRPIVRRHRTAAP